MQKAVQDTIQRITGRLNRLDQQVGRARESGDQALVNTLTTERNVLLSRLQLSQQRLDDLQPDTSAKSGNAVVLNSAELPTSPTSPNFLVNTIIALALGLALGVIVTLLRERLDDHFKDRFDVENTIGAPVLASVPKYEVGPRGAGGDAPTFSESFDGGSDKALVSESFTEGFRGLRTNLQHITRTSNVERILVTSAFEGEGKTVTTVNLGIALAKAGRRVILVSADLRRPTLVRHFDLEMGKGLSDWLSGEGSTPWAMVKESGIPNLRILPEGTPSGINPGELLTSPRLNRLIKVLMQRCDLLLFDSPPILPLNDAKIIAPLLDGVVLVIDAVHTKRSAAVQTKLEVERAGGKVLGCVLNFVDPSFSHLGYYQTAYRPHEDRQVADQHLPPGGHDPEPPAPSSPEEVGTNQP